MAAVISCVIPVYNAQATLPAAVESVLGQSYPYFELLLVDNASTDQSAAVCAGYARQDDRVRLLTQPKKGAAAARNAGLAAATGRYLTFVDADDILRPGAFEALARAGAAGPDVISFGFEHCGPAGRSAAVYPAFQCDLAGFWPHFVGYYQHEQFFSLCNKAYRLALIRQQGLTFDEALRTGEDIAFNFAFWPRIGSIAHLGESYYEYWVHPSTLTHSPTLDNLATSARVLAQLRDFLQAAGQPQLFPPLLDSQLPYDAACFYTLLLDYTKPYTPAQRAQGLAQLYGSEPWHAALQKGLAAAPGLYGRWLRLTARCKSPWLATLPLRLRGRL